MKVLLFIDSLSSGGAQNQIINLANGLAERGCFIDLVTYYPINNFKFKIIYFEQINHIQLFKKNKLGVNIIYELIKRLNTCNYSAAISFLRTPNFYLSLAKLFSKRTKTLFITSERSCSQGNFVLFQYITHYLSDFLFCNSFHESIFWKRSFPSISKKIFTMYNGIDGNKFTFSNKKSFNQYKIVCVSSVRPSKNIEVIIEALNILKIKFNFDLDVTYIGQRNLINETHKNYYLKLVKLLENYNLDKRWTWIDEVVNMNLEYEKYDVLIFSSNREGVPNVLCECLFKGLPIIASDLLDHPFLIEEPKRGFLFKSNDPNSLVDKILRFYLLTENEIIRVTKEQRYFAGKYLSIDAMVNKYYNFIKVRI